MRLNDVRQTLSFLYSSWPQPQIAIFHISGKDIGSRYTLDIIFQLKLDFLRLHLLLPRAVLIFSEVVLQLLWLSKPTFKYCEKNCVRINRAIYAFR